MLQGYPRNRNPANRAASHAGTRGEDGGMRAHRIVLVVAVAILLAVAHGCGAMRRSAEVGTGGAVGAAAGSLAGPAGAVAGAAIGAGVTHAFAENDKLGDAIVTTQKDVRDINSRLSGLGAPKADPNPPPDPVSFWSETPFRTLLRLLK